MMNKQKWINMFLPFIGGFFGGVIAILLFNPDTLFAKKQTEQPAAKQTTKQTTKKTTKQAEAPKVVTAEEFRLVDKNGKVCATLKANYTNDALHPGKENQDVQLRLMGEKGEIQLSAGEFNTGLDMSQTDYSKDQKLHSSIHLFTTGASSDLRLNYDQPVAKDAEATDESQASSENMKIQLSVNSYSETSNIRLFDNENNERANIGNAFVTKKDGTSANYPASSIHLYRHDGKVSWYERE
jgi:hypothetical protein